MTIIVAGATSLARNTAVGKQKERLDFTRLTERLVKETGSRIKSDTLKTGKKFSKDWKIRKWDGENVKG